MELRSFGVCQVCAELYPSAHACPSCDDDQVSARLMAEASATAHAAESPADDRRRRRRRRAGSGMRKAQQVAFAAGLCVTVALGTVLWFAA